MKNDFGKDQAIVLARRLAGQWGYLAKKGRFRLVWEELLEHFDGYEAGLVDRAATAAIGKATDEPPSVGAIKLELQALLPKPERPSWKDAGAERWTPPTPEELAKREEFCRQMRKQYPSMFRSSPKTEPSDDDLKSLERPFSEAEIESARQLNQSLKRLMREE